MSDIRDDRPRTQQENAFLFLAAMGGMMKRGQTAQAETLAGLLQAAAKSQTPGLEAAEIATAAKAWRGIFEENPRYATRLSRRVLDGASAVHQAGFDLVPPPQQPQRRAAAPKPRAP